MKGFQTFANLLRDEGSIWLNEDLTGDFMLYLGTETDIDYVISFDSKHPVNRIQFSLH